LFSAASTRCPAVTGGLRGGPGAEAATETHRKRSATKSFATLPSRISKVPPTTPSCRMHSCSIEQAPGVRTLLQGELMANAIKESSERREKIKLDAAVNL
jgi:hypothetical protein